MLLNADYPCALLGLRAFYLKTFGVLPPNDEEFWRFVAENVFTTWFFCVDCSAGEWAVAIFREHLPIIQEYFPDELAALKAEPEFTKFFEAAE